MQVGCALIAELVDLLETLISLPLFIPFALPFTVFEFPESWNEYFGRVADFGSGVR